MNKYEVVFNMRKDKMLFVFERCEHDDNKILLLKNLSFLSITSSVIITRSFKFIVKNKSNEESFDVDSLKDIKKRLTSIFRTFKEKMIQKPDFLNIVEINVLIYYYLTRSKENKLFSLTINEIYDIFIQAFEILSSIKRDNRILMNDSYLCNFEFKYKKCCEFYTSKNS